MAAGLDPWMSSPCCRRPAFKLYNILGSQEIPISLCGSWGDSPSDRWWKQLKAIKIKRFLDRRHLLSHSKNWFLSNGELSTHDASTAKWESCLTFWFGILARWQTVWGHDRTNYLTEQDGMGQKSDIHSTDILWSTSKQLTGQSSICRFSHYISRLNHGWFPACTLETASNRASSADSLGSIPDWEIIIAIHCFDFGERPAGAYRNEQMSSWDGHFPLLKWRATLALSTRQTFSAPKTITYPQAKALLKMIFLSPRWDMLLPWRVCKSQGLSRPSRPSRPSLGSFRHQGCFGWD